jgi:hypothetical protein
MRPQESQPIFSDRSISDFPTLILVDHPEVTNKDLSDKQLKEGRQLLDEQFKTVIPIESSPNPAITLARIQEAQGDRPYETAVAMGTGDGGSEPGIRAALGNGALFWKLQAGNSDNIGRASFPRSERGSIETIFQKGKIAIARAVECTVSDEDGNQKYHFIVLDEFGFGDSGAASEALNAQEHRDYRKTLSRPESLFANGKVSTEAVKLAKPFSIRRGHLEPDTIEDTRPVETYRELMYAKLGHIANGWVRDINMTDPKMVEVSNRRQSILATRLFFGRFYVNMVFGKDIPAEETIDFDIVEPTIMQKSGDHYNVAAGDHVQISLRPEKVLVYSTRRRP